MAYALNDQLTGLLNKLKDHQDSASYYTNIIDVFYTVLICDSFDRMPNAEGKIKPLYHKKNKVRTEHLIEKLANAGTFYMNHHNTSQSLRAWKLYVKVSDSPLFDKHYKHYGYAAYLASSLAYGIKDYRQADYYADKALKDNTYARDAAEIKVECMRNMMRTHNDSLKYVIALLELHDKAPENNHYKSRLVEYFTLEGREKQLCQFIDDELRKYPQNKNLMNWKGEALMRSHDWMTAIDTFKKALEVDSLYTPVIYNIGICYASRSLEIKDSIDAEKRKLTDDETDSIRKMLALASVFLERSRRLDPSRNIVDWATPLYQVYYALNDKRSETLKGLIRIKDEKDN